jgi:hypothetical protein
VLCFIMPSSLLRMRFLTGLPHCSILFRARNLLLVVAFVHSVFDLYH